MKLRNRKSYMTSLPEGQAPVSSHISITQMIYFLVLLSALVYLVYIFSSRFIYFKEDGIVEIEKTVISASRGGRLGKLFVKEGQQLLPGDALAQIEASRSCSRETDQRIDKLRYDIEVNRARKRMLDAEIEQNKKTTSGYTLYRALELGNGSRQENRNLQRQLQKMISDANLLGKQIILQQQRLKDIRQQPVKTSTPLECSAENINALFKARVSAVHKRVKEYAGRGEAIVTLVRENAPVRIELYMDNDELGYVQQDDILELVFADGVEGSGRIRQIHSSAYNRPGREWNKYAPADPHVLLHLEPLSEQDRLLWMNYDRLQVRVRGKR